MNIDKNLFALLKTARNPFVLSILFGALSGLIIIFNAGILSTILKSVFLDNKTLSQVSNLLLLLTLVIFFQFIFSIFKDWFAGKTSEHIKSGLRDKLVKHINDLGPIHSRKKSSGELSNLIVEGIDGIDQYFSQYLPQLFLAAIVPITILFFVFPADVLSGIILLLTAPLIPLFMILIGGAANKLTKRQWNSLSRMSSFFLDIFQGIVTLKIFNKSKDQLNEIKKTSDRFRHSTMKVLRVAFLSALTLEILASISTAIIAVEIGIRLLYNQFDFESAMFILILAPEFYFPLRRLGSHFHSGQESIAAATKLYEVLDRQVPDYEKTNKNLFSLEPSIIEFQNVSFKYNSGSVNAVTKLNLKIEQGSFTSLVGYSGAGKSTIINLLLKFISPTEGKIIIGKDDLSNISTQEWQKEISLIPQKPYMFNASVKDNIDIGKNYNMEQIIEAAKSAYIHEYIGELPLGYDTIIGEQGARLSGGQIQRLALARAFLKNSRLLIFDEPTSNLDPRSEELVFEAIRELKKNKTVITIAHKLKTIQLSDNIYVINNGKIEEAGSHDELMAEKKMYHKLVSAHV